MAPVIKEMEKYPDKIKSTVVVTAQHRQMLDQILIPFDIKPDYDLNIMKDDQSLSQVTTSVLSKIEELLKQEKPDIILVQGDTTTAFVASLASFYQKIPVGHIEAGLRTHNRYYPFPEEMNRRLTDALASLHFAPTPKAAENLLKEGISEKSIFVTGNTVIDALFMILARINNVELDELSKPNSKNELSIQPFNNSTNKLILVTAHRRENFGKPLKNICLALKEIAKKNNDVEIIYPVHLNPNVQKTVYSLLNGNDRVHLLKPLDYEPFVNLMAKSYLILTDSGGIQEEAPSLGKPVLVLRDVTERPEAVEAGTVRVVGTDKARVIHETEKLLRDKKEYEKMSQAINPYGDGKASQRIVNILIRSSKVQGNR